MRQQARSLRCQEPLRRRQ